MKKAIVIPNRLKDENLFLTSRVVNKLNEIGIAVYLNSEYSPSDIADVVYYDDLPCDADVIIVIGGDGSIIDASRIGLVLDLPLVGINLGKVGYLATLDPDKIDLLSRLSSGEYSIISNMLLSATKVRADGSRITCDRLAVNDVVISHESYLGISDLKVGNENGDQIQYRADGVIAATPAGSTAYSLSSGGPVISHRLDSITVTPICPHSFFNRSIVYSSDEVIRITNMEDNVSNISIDGRFFDRLQGGESCIVQRANKRIKMISLEDGNIFSTLSKKIKLLHDLV